jgi:hypothetical protein
MSKVPIVRGNTYLYLKFVDPVTGFASPGNFVEADRGPEVKKSAFNVSSSKVDVSSWDSGDWEENVSNIKSGDLPCEANYIMGSPYLHRLREAVYNGERVQYLLMLNGKPGTNPTNEGILGFARIMDFKIDLGGEIYSVSFGLTMDGEPTHLYNLNAFPAALIEI